MDLHRLFDVHAVALVGASERSPLARQIYEELTAIGFHGKLLPVNPKYRSVFGLPCFPDVAALPGETDAAILLVPRNQVLGILTACADRKIGAITVLTSGFSEMDAEGKQLQQEMTRLAQERDLLICGPNCFGYLAVYQRFSSSIVYRVCPLRQGNVAGVVQSGGLLNQVAYSGVERGIGFSYLISTGNEAVLTATDYLEHVLRDDHTEVVVAIIEGFKRPDAFLRVADLALDLEKPLIVMKIGRSTKGQRAAASHTGSLAGSFEVHEAVFRQKGVTRVDNFDQLSECIELFSKARKSGKHRIISPGVGVIEVSGGGCGLIADLAQKVGVDLPDLRPETRHTLEEMLAPLGSAQNPLDIAGITPDRDAAHHRSCLAILGAEPHIGIILSRLRGNTSEERFREVELADAESPKVYGVIARASDNIEPDWCRILEQSRVPFLREFEKGLEAVKALSTYSEFLRQRKAGPVRSRVEAAPDREKVQGYLQHAADGVLGEWPTMNILELYGFQCARREVADSAEAAVKAAQVIGFPVAIKAQVPGVAHKHRSGLVRLGLSSDRELIQAYEDISARSRELNSAIDQPVVLVQEMIQGNAEIILGMSVDPLFGPVVAFGLGGVWVETLHDVSLRLADLTATEARRMIQELRGFPILKSAGIDLDHLAGVILRFGRLAADMSPQIMEIDVNPLILSGSQATAVDGLMVLRELPT